MRPLFSTLAKGSIPRSSLSAWKISLRPVRAANVPAKSESIYSRFNLHRRPFTQSLQLRDSLYNVDHPAKLVRVNQKHGPGLIIIALIPIISFALGCWQVQRLDWKTKLIAKFEDRLEMLIGPRLWEGEDGFMVVTPLERGSGQSTVLVNRGWIPKKLANQKDRPDGLPTGEVTVEGLLREPWQKNMFTPANDPKAGKFYFPDIEQMAELTGAQPIWIEATMVPNLLDSYDRQAKGIPIGRIAEVNLRNNHSQYIFTWYGLSLATSIMLWMLVRKKPNEAMRRVRQNRNWS
ncbi:hypothetical protein N7468_009082 [Penicillium chermesinum]|uniref:SURF1-like protein n=1 Tax=Penicillium chermesinum TaxID=63820 RepID=A0A9W9NJR3_9EURO|nr:uncharacterized protein N7468_009082 [Penicillium chermesinum]KAJ5219878.1 hypothetical protein N7468_009082 [Penicillium chermesinum]